MTVPGYLAESPRPASLHPGHKSHAFGYYQLLQLWCVILEGERESQYGLAYVVVGTLGGLDNQHPVVYVPYGFRKAGSRGVRVYHLARCLQSVWLAGNGSLGRNPRLTSLPFFVLGRWRQNE